MTVNPKIANMVQDVIRLPFVIIDGGGEKSAFSQLGHTGYFEDYHLVTEADLIAALRNQPEIADKWIAWSEDKRVSRGPYISSAAQGEFEVGSYPDRGDTKIYRDKFAACADYIKREIESIRGGDA